MRGKSRKAVIWREKCSSIGLGSVASMVLGLLPW